MAVSVFGRSFDYKGGKKTILLVGVISFFAVIGLYFGINKQIVLRENKEKIIEEIKSLNTPAFQSAGDGHMYLVGYFDRFEQKEFDIKKTNGEYLGKCKLAYWLWYLDPDTNNLEKMRVVLLVQLPDKRNVVVSNIYEPLIGEKTDKYDPSVVKEFFKNRLIRGKQISIGFFPNFSVAERFYQSEYVDRDSGTNASLVYRLIRDYSEGVSGDYKELIMKRYEGNNGYILPAFYTNDFYQEDGVFLKSFSQGSN